ncbi:MAG: ImmA/IrrE family metallo-endopeptidase [Clostridia bacterium]
METLDLYKLAENEKIRFYYDLSPDYDGLYCNNCIMLNVSILNTKKEKEVLAEELGHHFMGVSPTPPFSTDYYTKLIRSKNEYKAKKWLINEIIPLNTLKSFLNQNMNKYDIAEELNVSASLVEDAFNIYEDKLKDGDINLDYI